MILASDLHIEYSVMADAQDNVQQSCVWRNSLCLLTVRQVPLIATLAPVSIASVLPGGNWIFIEEKLFCFVI